MVADELAQALVDEHVHTGARVLDPFCGSGRLLAAAENASLRVGFDVNPLAWLLARAKLANASSGIVANVLGDLSRGRAYKDDTGIELPSDRKVEWFASDTWRELERIVAWINFLRLPDAERLVVTAALSATVREVSYARQMGWKLHRLDRASRERFRPCPWEKFGRRLRYCERELRRTRMTLGPTRVELADLRSFALGPSAQNWSTNFDVVLTSPPYGDSRTTVQYGAASALCLSVVAAVHGFEGLAASGGAIDASCLGGRSTARMPVEGLTRYWAGSRDDRECRLVERFLADYGESCDAAAARLSSGGKAIFVVGRRTIGGHTLFLDQFTADRLGKSGMRLVSCAERPLNRKRLPRRINRFGRSADAGERARGVIPTMENEIILVCIKNE